MHTLSSLLKEIMCFNFKIGILLIIYYFTDKKKNKQNYNRFNKNTI